MRQWVIVVILSVDLLICLSLCQHRISGSLAFKPRVKYQIKVSDIIREIIGHFFYFWLHFRDNSDVEIVDVP